MPAVGLLAVALAVAALVALHVVGRSHSPVQRTISEYALIGPVQRALFAVFALCLAVAAFAVLVGAWSRPVAAVSLAVFTLGTTVAAFFPTDAIDPAAGEFDLSTNGRIHTVAALSAFIGLVVAGFAVGPVGNGPLSGVVPLLPFLGTVTFVVTLAARKPLARMFGVPTVHGTGERILVLADLAWLGTVLASQA